MTLGRRQSEFHDGLSNTILASEVRTDPDGIIAQGKRPSRHLGLAIHGLGDLLAPRHTQFERPGWYISLYVLS